MALHRTGVLLGTEERLATQSLLAALDPFREIRSKMSLQLVITFLLVASEEGRSQVEYARRAGIPAGVMTTHIHELSFKTRSTKAGAAGLDLIEVRNSPIELRSHEIYLTARGRALVQRMLRAWKLGGGVK
jgi:DNA-binding MarR family transcriptional regulator